MSVPIALPNEQTKEESANGLIGTERDKRVLFQFSARANNVHLSRKWCSLKVRVKTRVERPQYDILS